MKDAIRERFSVAPSTEDALVFLLKHFDDFRRDVHSLKVSKRLRIFSSDLTIRECNESASLVLNEKGCKNLNSSLMKEKTSHLNMVENGVVEKVGQGTLLYSTGYSFS